MKQGNVPRSLEDSPLKPSLGPSVPLGGGNGLRDLADDELLAQCSNALGQLLATYGCALQAVASISPEGRIVTAVQLVRTKR